MSVQLYDIFVAVFNFIQLFLVPNLLFQIIIHAFDFSDDPIYAKVLFNSFYSIFVELDESCIEFIDCKLRKAASKLSEHE